MKAYAIFDGGGVKGAALAGCLQSASEHGIKFEGFGGTSAGAIVALLASIDYTGEEINQKLATDVHPLEMLDDDGALFRSASVAISDGMKIVKDSAYGFCGTTAFKYLRQHRDLFAKIGNEHGLYEGRKLKRILLNLIAEKIPELSDHDDITFADLRAHGGKPLRIVASDLSRRKAIVFSEDSTRTSRSVIDAVRASTSYPIFFKPFQTAGDRRYVDGGLSSNLPAFLFVDQQDGRQKPTIAFDLQLAQPDGSSPDSFFSYLGRITDTAFDASDELIGRMVSGLKHIPVPLPAAIHTLKFDLSTEEINRLYDAGKAATSTAINTWDLYNVASKMGEKIHNQLKAYYGPPDLYEPVLRSLVLEIEKHSSAKEVRASIMLPTGRLDGSRIVVYSHGYRNTDRDKVLELSQFGGCSGQANLKHAPVIADLDQAKSDYEKKWDMTKLQQESVATDRRTMLSVPVFARQISKAEAPKDVPVCAILSVDTSTEIQESGWADVRNDGIVVATERVTKCAIEWAAVTSILLKHAGDIQ